jgi:hypothetical protein
MAAHILWTLLSQIFLDAIAKITITTAVYSLRHIVKLALVGCFEDGRTTSPSSAFSSMKGVKVRHDFEVGSALT